MKKIIIGCAVLLLMVVVFIFVSVNSDSSAMINSYVTAAVAVDDYDDAINTIEIEYKEKTDRPVLFRFWNLYIESCKEGTCLEVIIDPELSESNELTAYKAVQKFTLRVLKAPTTALFEQKEFLASSGEIGEQYSFSFTVDSENSFGAKIRSNCSAVVQNVGEYSWFSSVLNCK